jgi:phosphatidate phosphatase LPIN
LCSRKICEKVHFQAIHSESSDTFSDQSPTLAEGLLAEQNKPQMEMQFLNEEDMEALGAAAPPLPMAEELKRPAASTTQMATKLDSPRKKGMEPGTPSSFFSSCSGQTVLITLYVIRMLKHSC